MTIKLLLAGALGALAIAATPAGAQTVDQRHYNEQHRINQGVRSGRLTGREAYRLERQQRSIHRQESRMRYRHGGYLTGRDRAVLRHRENRASRHIYRAKHNYRHY